MQVVGVRVPPPAPMVSRSGRSPHRDFRAHVAQQVWKVLEMQVTETSSAGLKREFKVVLQAEELSAKLETQLADLKGKAQLKGFRPGKVPVAHLKRLYGRSIMGDVVQEAVTEANKKIVEENSLRLAVRSEEHTSELQS